MIKQIDDLLYDIEDKVYNLAASPEYLADNPVEEEAA